MARNIIITGAGSGIGSGIAEEFVKSGDRVHLVDLSQQRLEATAAALDSDKITTHVADVRDAGALDEIVKGVVNDAGSVDVLVSNAGVFDGIATIENTSYELWDKIIGINLTGTFNVVKAVAPGMIARRSGRIILIGSIAGQRALPDGLAYCASKAGLEGFTRRLAYDVAKYDMTANMVAPGAIRSNIRANSEEILGDLVPDVNVGVGANPELRNMIIPAQRYGEPSEIAATVQFLTTPGAAYINGEIIHVDGGWIAS